jgi:hypothetical protein
VKVFVVTRPNATPQQVAVLTTTKQRAINKVRDTYGYVAGMKAVERKEEGIILSKK